MNGRSLQAALAAVALLAIVAVASAALVPHLHSTPSCQICFAGHAPAELQAGVAVRLDAAAPAESALADFDPGPESAPPYSSASGRAPPA
jgi:hypothetical protein